MRLWHGIFQRLYYLPVVYAAIAFGWMGGLEAKLQNGERLILAFSGVRGEQDVGILRMAAENLKTFSIVDKNS